MRGVASGLYGVLGAALAASVSLLVAPASGVEPYEVDVGLWTCPRGYQIQLDGTCKSNDELAHGPTVEVSPLPSAGDGAPTTCPSGGCGSPFEPLLFSSSFVPAQLAYGLWDWPYHGGWPSWSDYGGWPWGRYSTGSGNDLHGGVAFWSRAPLDLLRWGGFQRTRQHFYPSSAQGARPGFVRGGVFGGAASGHRAGRGGRWRR